MGNANIYLLWTVLILSFILLIVSITTYVIIIINERKNNEKLCPKLEIDECI